MTEQAHSHLSEAERQANLSKISGMINHIKSRKLLRNPLEDVHALSMLVPLQQTFGDTSDHVLGNLEYIQNRLGIIDPDTTPSSELIQAYSETITACAQTNYPLEAYRILHDAQKNYMFGNSTRLRREIALSFARIGRYDSAFAVAEESSAKPLEPENLSSPVADYIRTLDLIAHIASQDNANKAQVLPSIFTAVSNIIEKMNVQRYTPDIHQVTDFAISAARAYHLFGFLITTKDEQLKPPVQVLQTLRGICMQIYQEAENSIERFIPLDTHGYFQGSLDKIHGYTRLIRAKKIMFPDDTTTRSKLIDDAKLSFAIPTTSNDYYVGMRDLAFAIIDTSLLDQSHIEDAISQCEAYLDPFRGTPEHQQRITSEQLELVDRIRIQIRERAIQDLLRKIPVSDRRGTLAEKLNEDIHKIAKNDKPLASDKALAIASAKGGKLAYLKYYLRQYDVNLN